jgi:AcrR family transcriptional regulator
MGKKKKLILEAARTLFNERGYSQVTIRMIAIKLNMSSGNLNYHYKKREDIFEALYFEMVSEFDERIKYLPNIDVSIAQIRNDIEQSMRRMMEYKYFWTDLYNLLAVSDIVKKHFQEVYKNRIDGCLFLFENMKTQNLMYDSSFKFEYNFLAERMVNYGNTWLYSTGLYSSKLEQKAIGNQVNTLLTMLYPFLAPKGQNEFKNLLPEFFG